MAGAIAFSGKAIIVKLAYRHGVDAVTLIMLRMLFALPLFVALACWAGRGKPALTATRLARGVAAWLQRLLPGELSRLLGLAVRQRQPGAADPVPGPDAGAAARPRAVQAPRRAPGRCWRWPSAMPACCWSSARSSSSKAADIAFGAALVFASTMSYALYLVYSGEEVKRLGALRLTGLATGVACVLCIAQFLLLRPLAQRAAGGHAGAVAVAAECHAVHLCAGADGDDGHRAHRRDHGRAGRHDRPAVDHRDGRADPGRAFTAWIAAGTVLVLVGIWLLTRWR